MRWLRRKEDAGFTLIELLVVIAIIALLLAILVPSLRKAKESAGMVVCQTNLRQYGFVALMYTEDNDGRFPDPWESLYSEFEYTSANDPYGKPAEIERYCRWHNAEYSLSEYPRYGGPLWPYLRDESVHMCPVFFRLGRKHGKDHPAHVDSIPIEPQFSYSMNGLLGTDFGVYKRNEVRRPSKAFFFGEENMWIISGLCEAVLNDNALITLWDTTYPLDTKPPFVDCFATFHKAPGGDLNKGVSNAVFVDGHTEEVHILDSYRLARPR